MWGKKGIARTREPNPFMKSAVIISNRLSSQKNKTWSWRSVEGNKRKSDAPFQFTASFHSKISDQLEGQSSGEAGVSDCRIQSKSYANEGVVCRDVEEGVEVDFSDDGGKHKSGIFFSHGFIVGDDAKPLVAGSDRRTITREAEGSMEEDAVEILIQDDSCRRLDGEDVGSPANSSFCNGVPSCNQAASSVQVDPGFQLTISSKSKVLVGKDGMDLEDGGGVDVPS